MAQHLYFIALVPPSPVFEQIEELKKDIFLEYGESHALKAPTHITLLAPFPFEEERLVLVKEELERITLSYRPFSVVVNGFRFFEPRVLFLHILQNRSLRYLEQILWDAFNARFPAVEWKPRKRFHPHISVAARITDETIFFRMQKDFATKPFHASFPVKDLVVLRWNDQHWEIAFRVPLQGTI